MKPFFSIIIPLYNSAATLSATLNSIARQSCEDIEVVFADGGSTDGTPELVNTFKSANPTLQIIWLPGPDKGIYDAMNKGIAAANGDWLYFMGSDDALASQQVLSQIQEAIIQSGADLVYGKVTGAASNTVYADDTLNKVLFRGIHHQGIFYKKNVFTHTGLYDLRFKVAADYHLTLKVFLDKTFKTQYTDVDIALFGEAGLSSQQYDWLFYSYHYRMLASGNAVNTQTPESLKCLNDSIYACFRLAKLKQALPFAWGNLLYYSFYSNGLPFGSRIRNLFRMVYWTLSPKA